MTVGKHYDLLRIYADLLGSRPIPSNSKSRAGRFLIACAVFTCLGTAGNWAHATDSVVDMTGRITRDCLMNNGFGFRFRYSHADQLCHTTEPTVTGDFLTLSWTPLCKESPTDNKCPWPAGNCCVYCGFKGETHTSEGTKGKAMAPGSYTLAASASPTVESGSPLGISFGFSWSPSGDINSIITCAGGGDGITLQPNESWSMRLIVPDLGQTNRLVALPPLSQRGFVGSALAKPFSVKVETTDNKGVVTGKKGVSVSFTVAGPSDGRRMTPVTVTTGDDGTASSVLTLGSSLGTYTVTAFCADCPANQQVTFSATAVKRPVPKPAPDKPATGPGACSAGILPPPPLEICVGDALPLHCLCKPISAQRSVDWSPSNLVTKNFQVPEDAIFQSAEEGDFPVSLHYSVSQPPGTTPANCDASTVVKVRDVQIVGLSVDPGGFNQGGQVSLFAPEKINLLVTLNRPHSDISAFELVTVGGVGGGASITRSIRRGATLIYQLSFPNGGNYVIRASGCAGSKRELTFIVAPPIP